jgi:metal-sulfur cluster biosynthetic enzyme
MQPTIVEIFAALRTSRSPEIPVDLGELGLFHGVGTTTQRFVGLENRDRTPSRPTDCPIAHGIAGTVQRTLEMLADIRSEIGCGLVLYSGLFSEVGLLRSQPAS